MAAITITAPCDIGEKRYVLFGNGWSMPYAQAELDEIKRAKYYKSIRGFVPTTLFIFRTEGGGTIAVTEEEWDARVFETAEEAEAASFENKYGHLYE